MIFPMINNRNQKQSENNGCFPQSNSFSQQFGLGIQVIKIQSSKTIQPHNQKQKKLTRNIENPISEQPTVQGFKRTPILPSLSTDKKAKTGGLNDTFKERKATVEKKKMVLPTDTIKQFEEKHRFLEKKTSSIQQINKTIPGEQLNAGSNQNQVIQKHYRRSMNQILDFYQRFDQRQTENIKEIKRLKKSKDSNEEQLNKQLKLKENKIELTIDLVNRQKISFFKSEEEYDEFSLINYAEGSWQFKFHDIEPSFQY